MIMSIAQLMAENNKSNKHLEATISTANSNLMRDDSSIINQKESFRWDENVWIFGTTNHEKHPSLCYDYNNDAWIFAAAELWDGYNSPKDLMIKRSINHGETWTATDGQNQNTILGSLANPLFTPQITQISNNKIGMIYVRQYSTTDWDIRFRSFLHDNLAESVESFVDTSIAMLKKPSIVSDYLFYPTGPYIHIAYINESVSPKTVVYRRSIDLGTSWFSAETIGTISNQVENEYHHTSIDLFGDNIAVAYVDRVNDHDAVKVVVSHSSGGSWLDPEIISTSRHLRNPQIRFVNEDNIIVVFEYWYSDSDIDVYYAYSHDSGNTFSAPQFLATSTENERFPNVSSHKTATTGSDVYITYTMLPDEVYVQKASNLQYSSWENPVAIKQSINEMSTDDLNAIIVKPYNGVPKCAVAWTEYYTIYDADVKFDAEWRGDVSVDDNITIPAVTRLKGNYPNPFNPDTNIEFYMAEPGLVSIDIYNIRGQRIRTLVNETYESGTHRVLWNGEDEDGRSVGSGVYFYNMRSGNYIETKKMIMIK